MLNAWGILISKITDKKNRLVVILAVGLIHGLIFVFLTPPWWHHDEPGHFQVARFIADHGRRPEWGEYDGVRQEELKLSLDEHGVFDYINYSPDSDEAIPAWVLAVQVQDPPLYYSIASVPLRLLKNSGIAVQNRALRILSLSFFLLTLWMSWELGGDLFGQTHPLRSISAIFLALLPGFVNEMTAIANTPLGTLFFTFFLLAGVRLLRHGFSWKNTVFFLGSAVLSYFTNNLVWLSIAILTPIVFLFLLFRKRLKWLPWAIILLLFLSLSFFVFEWGDARYWYQNVPTEAKTRQVDEASPFGDYVLQVPYNDTVRQRIPIEALKPLRSQTITLGFWAWASVPIVIDAPDVVFSTEGEQTSSPKKAITLDLTPTFYSIPIDVPYNSGRGWININPATEKDITLYFDQIVLAEGGWAEEISQFDDLTGQTGQWQDAQFVNLIRNGSFEDAWFGISPFTWKKGLYRFSTYFSSPALATALDWQSSGWYFKQTLIVFNETFWGRFGPSTVPMLGSPYIYQVLRVTLVISLAGVLSFLWRKFKIFDKKILFVLGLSIFIIWGQALLRGASTVDFSFIVIPWARYALPAFVPTVMVLCAGWYLLISKIENILNLNNNSLQFPILIAFMLSLDILAILTMLHFFYLQTQWPYLVLFIALLLNLAVLFIIGKQAFFTKKENVEPQ